MARSHLRAASFANNDVARAANLLQHAKKVQMEVLGLSQEVLAEDHKYRKAVAGYDSAGSISEAHKVMWQITGLWVKVLGLLKEHQDSVYEMSISE